MWVLLRIWSQDIGSVQYTMYTVLYVCYRSLFADSMRVLIATWPSPAFQFSSSQGTLAAIDKVTWRVGHVTLVTITGTTSWLVHYLKVKSLQLIWRSGTRRWNLRVPDLQMSCRDLTPCQGTRIEAPCVGSQMTCLIPKNWSRWSQSIVVDCEYYYNMTVDLGGKFCHSSRLN